MNWIKQKFIDLFSIDTRSLAIFRVGLALLIIADLFNRAEALQAHYSDFGLLPRGALLDKFSNFFYFSIHFINGSLVFQTLLFILAGVLALFLLMGYRTRWVMVFSWIMLTSLHNRNYMVLQGGDTLFRMLAFWGMFLPLGLTLSMDRALDSSGKSAPRRIFSGASIAILIQTVIVYWTTVLFKNASPWSWKDATAVYTALQLDQFVTPFGLWVASLPIDLLKWVTRSTFGLEIMGPILILFPFYIGPIRTILVFLMMSMHLVFSLHMELGLFPYISVVSWMLFLPTWFWDKIFLQLRNPERVGFKIYYDGECGFCKKGVRIFRTFFLLSETPIIPAQNHPNIYKIMQEKNSWVVKNSRGDTFTEYQAWIELTKVSPLLKYLTPIFSLSWIQKIGGRIYRKIANNRKTAGLLTRWLKYRPLKWKTSYFWNVITIFLLIYVIAWNLRTLDFKRFEKYFPKEVNWLAHILRLDQKWSMFSPKPLVNDGWYVISGTLKNGTKIDLFQDKTPPSFEKPEYVAYTYHNQRWRKYMMNIYNKDLKDHRLYLGKYICRKWNQKHQGDEQLDRFKIYFMLEVTGDPGKESKPVKQTLWKHYCFEVPENEKDSEEETPNPQNIDKKMKRSQSPKGL